MSGASSSLLDEALSLQAGWRGGRFLLVEDCVETSGAFVLHHLLKHALPGPGSSTAAVIFVAVARPFSHYDRILRKLGCNLSAQRDSGKLHFFDELKLGCQVDAKGATEGALAQLFDRMQKVVEHGILSQPKINSFTIIFDDFSLLEIASRGSINDVLNILHYCTTLTSEENCTMIVLNHADIYCKSEPSRLLAHLEYIADIIIKVEPLLTGLAVDVHGQLTVVNKRCSSSGRRAHNFHFKVKENCAEYFYPGKLLI